jgi:hypothetical protein
MSAFGGPNIIDDGLVLYLDAGNRKSYVSGSTTWFDKSGRGNNGTLTNGPTFNSANLGSVVFDGTNDYVDCGNDSSISFGQSRSFTIEIIFNTANYIQSLGTLIARRNSDISSATDYMVFYESGNKFTFGIGAASSPNSWTSVSDFNVNNQIMAFTGVVSSTGVESGQKIMYKNGVELNNLTYSVKASSTTNNTYIGKYNGSGGYFNGNIFSVKVYNRALSPQEVLQNYNATKGRFGL